MLRHLLSSFVLFVLFVVKSSASAADPDVAALVKDPDRRAAWEKVVARGPAVLPALLDAMNTPDTAAANWLRTAFDRIVETDLASGGKRIDVDVLIAYAKDAKRPGRARRLALGVAERLRPGTEAKLIPGWLEDPEFRFDAVAELVRKAGKEAPEQAKADLRRAFAASRDIEQAKGIAAKLDRLGERVSVVRHLGFLLDWYAVGPFDGKNMKGFATAYPPEEKVDLSAELAGKSGPLRWKRFRVKEPSPSAGGRFGLINLREPLGDANDAVGYAYTVIAVPKACEAEFRGAADDNLSVWVNGKKVFGFEEYRNGVRHDRHRFKVPLRAGENAILVKVCQAPLDPSSPEPNWEFLLRVVDQSGKGLEFKDALPEK